MPHSARAGDRCLTELGWSRDDPTLGTSLLTSLEETGRLESADGRFARPESLEPWELDTRAVLCRPALRRFLGTRTP